MLPVLKCFVWTNGGGGSGGGGLKSALIHSSLAVSPNAHGLGYFAMILTSLLNIFSVCLHEHYKKIDCYISVYILASNC